MERSLAFKVWLQGLYPAKFKWFSTLLSGGRNKNVIILFKSTGRKNPCHGIAKPSIRARDGNKKV